ncbi:MAG: hypothetical protein NC416_18485 [Eubacterium sp.]|nr:hypothetical protein [Eubacterium sp.]
MKQREIKRKLKQYASVSGKPVPMKKELRIQELLQIAEQKKGYQHSLQTGNPTSGCVPRTRGNLWTFLLEQIGYLGRYCLVWQAAWAVLFCYMVQGGAMQLVGKTDENRVLAVISLLPPLLVLLTVEEVTKVYQRSMLEIEYATKYSLRSVVMIRMAVLCVMHFMILALCIACMHSRLESNAGRLLIYGITPMLLMTGAMLKLMQHCQGDILRGAAVGVYLLAVVLAAAGSTQYFAWYQTEYFKVWCMACALGIAFAVRQFMCLNWKLASYERIVQQGYE